MAFQSLNLARTELPSSNLLQHLPRFEEIYYDGHLIDKVQQFRAVREGQECKLLAVTLIRKDEDFLWDSTEDLLSRSVKDAAVIMRGIYTFDLLTFDLHRESGVFNPRELTEVLKNTSLRMKAGEQTLVRYCSMYGLLKKMVDEPWGKVTLKTAVELFNDKPNYLFTLVSKVLKKVEFAHGPVMVLLNDLSVRPLYDAANQEQKMFLDDLRARHDKNTIEFRPEVFSKDKNGIRELL